MAQGLAAALGHHFDRQAAVEIGRALEFAKLGLFRRQKRVDERLVLVAAHRAIDVSLGVAAWADLVVARLHPRHVHIDRMAVDDRRDRVEKGERAFAGQLADRLGQRRGGERPRRDDHIVPVLRRQAGDLGAVERYERMTEKRGFDGLREAVAIDGERASGRHLVRIGALKDDRAERAHLAMQDPDRVGRRRRRIGRNSSKPARRDGQCGAQPSFGVGRISCRITGTPEFAACHAASEPASPPPMMWIGRMGALVTKLYAIVNAFCRDYQ